MSELFSAALREQVSVAGLTQLVIAAALGWLPSSVTRAIDEGRTRPIEAITAAWLVMTEPQRAAWLAALGVPAPRRRGRPRKP